MMHLIPRAEKAQTERVGHLGPFGISKGTLMSGHGGQEEEISV